MIGIKRAAVTTLSAALVAGAIGSSPAMAFKDKDCSDFKGLDADNDGIACEDLP